MAAYAALASLMNTVDQIQIHPQISTYFHMNHIESLGDTVGLLLDFIETYNCGGGSTQVEHLEGQIACAAHAAEDAIESHVVDQILAGSTKKHGGMLQKMMTCVKKKAHVICNLQKVMEDMDSIKERVENVEKQGRFKDEQIISSRPVTAAGKTAASMVGFDDYLIHLMDKLTCLHSHQQVIPIIGMGGVGKTTLATNAFHNTLIKQHFDVCAWATISHNYNAREILLEILSSHDEEASTKFGALNEQELGEKLHKCLFNRRYLIILDDMWSTDVWDDIKFFFPDNNNGSRIVVTTRLLDVALHFNSSYLTVGLLDEDKSWNLFCQESFGEEGGCPAELEDVGKKICENCKGLPLSIVVIGGFLQKSSKSREYLEGVARDTFSILNSEGENQCMKILSLSYNYLPAHLKPCFLYMGVFGEDEEIRVSRLIKLWVAEGFLRRNDGQSLEEVGEGYLNDLVGRNLILVKRWGSNGNIRACNIHDLLRELCLSVAEKEKFIYVMKLVDTPRVECRIVVQESMSNPIVSRYLGSASLVRSLMYNNGHRRFNFRLLRVLKVVDKDPCRRFLKDDLSCVNLRCLDDQIFWSYDNQPSLHIPKKISLLWNLQTVRIKGYQEQIIAPSEFWEMVQLRHFQANILCLPDPRRNGRVDLVLQNLQTLGKALNFRLSEEVCKRIPNLKRLHLEFNKLPQGCDEGSYYCLQNLGLFHKLESLTLRLTVLNQPHAMQLNMTFPSSLKKLCLFGGDLNWEDLDMIGSLPSLEVLKLRAFSMIGSEWNPVEGEFRSLKFLQISMCQRLSKWNADYFHYPVLEKLVLEYLFVLDEIPLGIGEIPTLRTIRLYNCNVPCALSAVKILEEQESLGNEDLQVEIGFHIHNKDTGRFREIVEQEAFTSNNLHINSHYF